MASDIKVCRHHHHSTFSHGLVLIKQAKNRKKKIKNQLNRKSILY